MLNFALKYLNLGFSVIPLRPKSKEPLLPWQEFQSRRASESEIREWFLKWPDANIGLVTGKISSICVVDLDGPKGIQEAQRLGLSSSITSITGNGKHLWYKNASESVGNAVRVQPGIDIRGEGGYVVAPPSIHENERRYHWLGVLNVENLPEYPRAILEQKTNSVEAVSPI